MTFPPIDWSTWKPQQLATLGFVQQDNKILLIRKKRGLGAGKINGFGGKLELGETPVQCIIREAEEELRIDLIDPEFRGELFFQFTDGYSLHCAVFVATQFGGIPEETAEAIPVWHPVSQIPFDEMWEDDRLWLNKALDGHRFKGYFYFDGDKMLSHSIDWENHLFPS
jgi:8-oxo-dGTP diphosphatase